MTQGMNTLGITCNDVLLSYKHYLRMYYVSITVLNTENITAPDLRSLYSLAEIDLT